MKPNSLLTALLFAGILLFGSCKTPPPVTPPEDLTYTLSSDRTTAAINEEITFTITDSNDKDVTAEWNICDELNCFISNKVAWEAPGTYIITAHNKENPEIGTENTLTVTIDGTFYTIHADKTTIFEQESVTFSLTETIDGVLQKDPPYGFIARIQDGEQFKDFTNIFPHAGVYTVEGVLLDFAGKVKKRASNTIQVVVKKRPVEGFEENYYRRSLLAELTGTWCTSCPMLVHAIEYCEEYFLRDRFVTVAFHDKAYFDGDKINDECLSEIGDHMRLIMGMNDPEGEDNHFGYTGIPQYIVDWNKAFKKAENMGTIQNGGAILARRVEAAQATYDMTPGLAAETTLTGRTFTMKLKTTPRETAEYLLGAIFVVDGQKTKQVSGDIKEADGNYMIQNNVAHQFITTGDNTNKLDELGTLNADQEYEYSYTYTIPERHELANSRVVFYICKKDATIKPYGYFCANAMSCKAGASVDYEFEPIYGE